jgi:ubiquinone/menaquinone biosynthesis C-methylase UbiE
MGKETNEYIISGGQEGKSRLKVLSTVLYTYTKTLLETQGLSDGKKFLDLGCGGGDVSFMAAGIVGNTGHVTAIDFDGSILALAKREAEDTGIANINFEQAGAYDISYNNEFDISYARFLLSHLTEPANALKLMVLATAPGGKIVVEDLQFSGHFCYPACPAFENYLNWYSQAATNNGHNPEIGPSLVNLFREAGVENIGFDVITPCFYTGLGKWMGHITLDKIKNTIVKQQIATTDSIDEALNELEAFTQREDTIISMPRIFRVWGTKP